MITAAQLRAARGLLDWTRSDLAKAANISPETIKNIEHGTFRPQETTAEAIIQAFAVHGVEFTDNDGVRCIKDSVSRFEGVDGFKKFLDDVYEVAKMPSSTEGGNKPLYISHVDDRYFITHLGEFFNTHIKRMNELKSLKMRILVNEKPHSLSSEEKSGHSYREYKQVPTPSAGNVPFYVYGDKLGILIFEESKPVRIVVIASELVSKAYRDQFDGMWKNAKAIEL
jgi:DNA-binding XRE family transcriptional regulator